MKEGTYMAMIEIMNLTKDYGHHKGIFNVTINIEQGEVYGYLGPNGAGKSTTMRHLMGFSKCDQGSIKIKGFDCWKEQKQIQPFLGYLPGEIAFPNDMNGKAYLHMIAKMRHMPNIDYAKELLQLFEIDPNMSLNRMSKGMKQKIGIVSAFMHQPEVILLDEPTSGLDPLMQSRFLDLVELQKQQGKTIIMSSHMFEEVERTCDRIGIIKQGTLIQEVNAEAFERSRMKTYRVEVKQTNDLQRIMKSFPNAQTDKDKNQALITIQDDQINALLQLLAPIPLVYFKEEKHTLEEYFMKFYGGEEHV